MNTVLVLVLLILVIFALKEGMIWVALGVGLLMVLLSSDDTLNTTGTNQNTQQQMFQQDAPLQPTKEQMLRVKYQPSWDGNTWWEEMPEHFGTGLGRMIGMFR